MALTPEDDELLARAARAAREEDPPADWPEVARSVRERVARSVTPASRVHAREDDGADGSRTYVSTRVVAAAVRATLRTAATHAPSGVDLRVDGERLHALRLELVVAYGVDVPAFAAAVRRDVLEVVAALVGRDPERAVDVAVVDVVDGDPRRV